MSGLDWGDVPTWTSTVVSAVALGAAWFAARASWNVLKIETQRDNDADERAQRAQADLVAAWLVNEVPSNRETWHVCVANESKIPVYDVQVIIMSSLTSEIGEDIHTAYAPLVPPGQTLLPLPALMSKFNDGGGSAKERRLMSGESGVRLVYKVLFTFRDAAGENWERTSTGVLARIPRDRSDVIDGNPT